MSISVICAACERSKPNEREKSQSNCYRVME